jgi:SAM-dependent methyltransferase
MFFVSHSAEAVREMCERAIVIDHGRVQFDGDTEAGIRNYRRVLAHAPARIAAGPPAASADRGRQVGPDVHSWHRRVVGGLWDEAGERHVAFLREQGLKPSDAVLDIGCGSLRTGVRLLQYLEPGRYVGIDQDASLIAAGTTIEAELAGVDPGRGQYFVANAIDLSGVEEQFDVIWMNGLIQDLPHETAALALASAVQRLSSGGRLFVAYFEAPIFLSVEPIERPGPCFSYFDRTPRHFDFETLARYVDAAGGRAERLGSWDDPHGQMMLVVTAKIGNRELGITNA